MKKIILLAMVAGVLLFTGSVQATPVIDGNLTTNEWLGSVVNAWDPNETNVDPDLNLPDTHDINWIRMYMESSGTGNGLYGLVDLYGNPTWQPIDDEPGHYVQYAVRFDLNNDGDFNDSVDRTLIYNSSSFTLYSSGYANIVSNIGMQADMGDSSDSDPVVEFFIPSGMFASGSYGDFKGEVTLENGGLPNEDKVPDSGRFSTTPEPASMALLSLGLVGLVGRKLKKRFMV